MKILYVALSMRGIEDIIAGENDNKGLPSFVYPLRALIQAGHNVKIILISNYRKEIKITVDWLKAEDIVYNANSDFSKYRGLGKLYIKTKETLNICKVISQQLRKGQYDFVYCHGKAALPGNIMANLYKVPCGYRLYGTINMYKELTGKGKLYTICKNPSYFVLFNLKKKFILNTDDGTHGDYVENKLRLRKDYEILYWKNGVDKPKEDKKVDAISDRPSYLFTAGRVCEVKAQHKSIQLFAMLAQKYCDLDLYIAGSLVDDIYYRKLIELIKRNGIENRVHFLGDINRPTLMQYAQNATAVLLFAGVSNLSNVMIECAASGSVIVTYDEGPLHEFIENGTNGFFVNKSSEACGVVERIINMTPEEIIDIKNSIKARMDNIMISWDERCKKEILLIENAIKR